MRDIKTLVGTRIKELRKERALSQEDLAYLAGLDRTYITSVENGKRNISIVNIDKISNAMNIDLYHFFNSKIFMKGIPYE
ncbi:MAG: helix-turn-helix transcriptional regulator [Eubacteriales bacterium]|jgi:transcriptional regulator with XRE-family HTH domain|nr:helix-turn-helix transcriptional regulator [Clostridiales bacterium]